MSKIRYNWSRQWMALAVLLLGLGLTLFAWNLVRQTQRGGEQQRFQRAVDLAGQALGQEMERYTDLLRAARGFWYGSEVVSREEWKTYVESINLQLHAPGVQGVGFLRRVDAGKLAAHVAGVKTEVPDYQVWPEGPRDVYFPVEYIEPMDERNKRSLGFDMYSETVRRSAMQEASRNGKPVASGTVTLIQDTEQERVPGFLIYIPVYRRNAPVETEPQRVAALEGFIYSPYRTSALIHGILDPRHDLSGLRLQIFDGVDEKASLIFDNGTGAIDPLLPLRQERLPFVLAGRVWTLSFYGVQGFQSAEDSQFATLTLLGGLLSTWLIFGMLWLQIRGRMESENATAEIERADEALKVSEMRYRLKIEQSPVAIQVFANDGRSLYVNRAWEELWGVSAADVGDYNLLKDPELERLGVREEMSKAFTGQSVVLGPRYYESWRLPTGKHGRPRWVRTVMYPIVNTLTGVGEVVQMHEDFTQRKLAEEELRNAKEEAEAANRAKDQFLAVLSHELRNPLAPVLSMINVLQYGEATGEEIHNALEVIQRNVELEARLIDDLLDVTRISRGKLKLHLEQTDAHVILQHALEICSGELEARNQRVTVKLEAAEHFVLADPARLQQVFWNLLKNAVKFTPEGGTIEIWTENHEKMQAVHASGNGSGKTNGDLTQPLFLMAVRDSGIGIAPEALGRIFRAFEQADRSISQRFGGLGLGLTISKALIDAHDGELSAKSEGRDCGATFLVQLPTVARPMQTVATGAIPARGPLAQVTAPLRLLIVEDQADTRRAMQILLRKLGHNVEAAAGVQDALRLGQEQTFDVLISDLGLPDGSGLDIVRALKARQPNMRAIALSGLGMEEDVHHSLEAGFDRHMTKPVHFIRLQTMLEELAVH